MSGAPIPDCIPSVGNNCLPSKAEIFCDNATGGLPFLRIYVVDCVTGEPTGFSDFELDGTTPYVLIGDAVYCGPDITIPSVNIVDAELLCFDAGQSPLMQVTVYDPLGGVISGPVFLDPLTGAVVVPGGNVIPCPGGCFQTIILDLCDKHPPPDVGDGLLYPFLRVVVLDCTAGILSVFDVELDGTTPYGVSGTVARCTEVTGVDGGNVDVDLMNQFDAEFEVLCDDNGTFLRRYTVNAAAVATVTDWALDGVTPYVTVGSVGVCPTEITADTGALVRSGHQLLSGVGTWALGVDTGGGKVKSISFRRRAGGVLADVTIADDFGNADTLATGEAETWSVTGLEDQLTGTLSVTSTAAATRVIIDWTEV